MIANGLPNRGDNPKLVPKLASVGPTVCPRPSRALNIRAIVPLPLLVGPMSSSIFCISVRPDST